MSIRLWILLYTLAIIFLHTIPTCASSQYMSLRAGGQLCWCDEPVYTHTPSILFLPVVLFAPGSAQPQQRVPVDNMLTRIGIPVLLCNLWFRNWTNIHIPVCCLLGDQHRYQVPVCKLPMSLVLVPGTLQHSYQYWF